MSLITAKNPKSTPLNIDSLLQDSYLLVVELRQGSSVRDSGQLANLCAKQIKYVRKQLEKTGLSPRSIDHISHAQCALLDETVLTCAAPDARDKWAGEPLQAKFFSRHQAGEFLYEEMREVLREPAPDLLVLTVFQRVLMLGFQGRYREANDPERAQLLAALNTHVAPLKLTHTLPTKLEFGPRMGALFWSQSPLINALAVGTLLAGCWWGLDQFLGHMIATLTPELLK